MVSCKKQESTMVDTTDKSESASAINILEDLQIYDINRSKVALSSEISKHKVTIIDFWASWCAPCMRSMPLMVELYKEFSPKGLGIIGISYDKEYSAWTEAIKNNKMEWLQLSELRGWEDTTVGKYGIRAIPYTIVVNEKSEILAKGLAIEELKLLVGDLLK